MVQHSMVDKLAREFPPITTIIPDLKAGDEESWNSLVNLFSPSLSGKAHVLIRSSRLNGKLEPDDLVSETFAKSWKHHAHLRGESTFQVAKWLLTIMTNTFRDACRRGGLQEEPEAYYPDEIATFETPLTNAESVEEEIKLHAKLAELDEDDREIIVLRYWHQMTHEEIGQKLGRSRLSITRQLQKAIPKLQRMMERGS